MNSRIEDGITSRFGRSRNGARITASSGGVPWFVRTSARVVMSGSAMSIPNPLEALAWGSASTTSTL